MAIKSLLPFGTIKSRSVPKLEAVDRRKTSVRFLTYDISRASENSDTCYSTLCHVKITTSKKIDLQLGAYFLFLFVKIAKTQRIALDSIKLRDVRLTG